MAVRPWRRPVPPILLALLALGCGSDEPTATAPDDSCLEVRGEGSTVGHVRSLVGSGVFDLGGQRDSVHVGVYLNSLRDVENDRKRLTIVYQFTWPRGDMILTEDDVILYPFLEENQYEFEEALTVKSTRGMFAGLEGRSPLEFRGVLRFGPPPEYTSLGSVHEEFHASGVLCLG